MGASYWQIFIPVICLLLNVLTQVLLFRLSPGIGLLKSIYLGFSVGFIGIIFFGFYITNLIIYALLAYCYFHFVNLGETARRIRLLRELYDSKAGLTMEEILKQYNANEIITKRIHRLLNNGQILLKDDRYYIGNKVMLWITKTIVLAKLLILGKKSEFD